MDKKEYVSMQLVSGVTILCQMANEDKLVDSYLVYYPLKPMAIGEKIVLVPMNPFSDETIYKINKNQVLSYGSMNFTYIDDYNESVDRIEKAIKQQYEDMTKPQQDDSDIKSIYVAEDISKLH